jgi:hypothetical protein
MLIIVGNAEARKMLENAAESHQSSARGVSMLPMIAKALLALLL